MFKMISDVEANQWFDGISRYAPELIPPDNFEEIARYLSRHLDLGAIRTFYAYFHDLPTFEAEICLFKFFMKYATPPMRGSPLYKWHCVNASACLVHACRHHFR